jgi:trimeric autotransporter adhesin
MFHAYIVLLTTFLTVNFTLATTNTTALNGRNAVHHESSISSGIITTVSLNNRTTEFALTLKFPLGVTIDEAGNYFITDSQNNRILKVITSTGLVSTVAGNGRYRGYNGDGIAATSAWLFLPGGIAVDTSGNFFIADTWNHRIRKVTASTGIISTVAGNGDTFGISKEGDPTKESLRFPHDVALDRSGNIFIADTSNGRILKITSSTGIISTVAGNYASLTTVSTVTKFLWFSPYGVTVDTTGNIFIAAPSKCCIYKVLATTGLITVVAGKNGTCGYNGDNILATAATLNEPYKVAVDSSGNIYVADTLNDRIRKISASTGIITTVAGNYTIRFPIPYVGDGGSATAALLNRPRYVAVDTVGDILISDTQHNGVRKVTYSEVVPSAVEPTPTPVSSKPSTTTATPVSSKPSAPTATPVSSKPSATTASPTSSAMTNISEVAYLTITLLCSLFLFHQC